MDMNNENTPTDGRSLSYAPYFPAINRNKSEYKLFVFADMVKIESLNPPVRDFVPSTRKKVKGLSDKSRKRMIEHLAMVVDVPDLFVTLTYSDDIASQAYLRMHRDFEAFRKRLERAYPNIKAVWRIEFQVRKSGRLQGQLIPHIHMLMWLPETVSRKQRALILKKDGELWRKAWHAITHSVDKYHLAKYGCQVERIHSRNAAYKYAAKYVAKDVFENLEVGRRWGMIGKFDYPTEYETTLTTREYIHFKRLLNKYIKIRNPKFYKQFKRANLGYGCSVFGLGFISQRRVIGTRTVYRMIRHARQLAQLDYEASIETVRE